LFFFFFHRFNPLKGIFLLSYIREEQKSKIFLKTFIRLGGFVGSFRWWFAIYTVTVRLATKIITNNIYKIEQLGIKERLENSQWAV